MQLSSVSDCNFYHKNSRKRKKNNAVQTTCNVRSISASSHGDKAVTCPRSLRLHCASLLISESIWSSSAARSLKARRVQMTSAEPGKPANRCTGAGASREAADQSKRRSRKLRNFYALWLADAPSVGVSLGRWRWMFLLDRDMEGVRFPPGMWLEVGLSDSKIKSLQECDGCACFIMCSALFNKVFSLGISWNPPPFYCLFPTSYHIFKKWANSYIFYLILLSLGGSGKNWKYICLTIKNIYKSIRHGSNLTE